MFFKKKKENNINIPELVEKSSLKHMAFIMDGNGRWAQERNLPREAGHKVGADTFEKIVRYCGDVGIQYVTVYAFSTENWKRPEREVNAIMALLDSYILKAKNSNDENMLRYIFIGDKTPFSNELREKMGALETLTKDFKRVLNIAMNYGGRDEIVNTVNALIKDGKTEITKEDIDANLYTKESPDPDMIVRTGNEKRISNFLMWQSAYSELYFSEKYWPDFSCDDVDKAVIEFSKRKRRFGGV